MLKRFSILLCVLSFLCLFIGGAFVGFERIALDPVVYDSIQSDLDVYPSVGVTPEAQSRINRVLAGYLRGDLPSIDTEEEVFGVYGPVFNEDEKAHMVDVLGLFRLERLIRTACLTTGLALLSVALFTIRAHPVRTAAAALKFFLLILLAAATALVLLWTSNGFTRLFIAFHHLFFTNDLWLMDPSTDAMIRMLPSDFFLRIAAQSGANALIYGFVLTAAALAILLASGFINARSGRKQTP